MAYQKQTVLTGDLITADWGNYIQTQYDAVKSELGNRAGELWAQIRAADGTGSELDADTVDGLHVTGSGTPGLRKITISTAAPSGGADGDVWFQYA